MNKVSTFLSRVVGTFFMISSDDIDKLCYVKALPIVSIVQYFK